ncbi:hypothetical protein H4217_007121 [Coemansia sp. RSA 1939]|nr:hypothetical protein H4217_007121 [Coemansia sp. RSA 1939]
MEQFGHVDKLLASLNRLVEEDVEPTTPKDDRFKSIEETLQAVTSNIDEVNQRVKQIVELCYSQGQVFTKIYYRSEAANKDTESQLKEIKKQIAHLSGQLQAAIQIGSHGSHGSGVSFPGRFLNSAQLSPISAGTSVSPVSTTAFVPASTTPQAPNVSSIPSIFERSASSMIQPNVPAFDDRMGTATTPATNETPFRAHILQADSGSDSGTDIDYLIEQRFSHTEGSSRRNDRGEVDIGIVGASTSNKGSNSSRSISKGKVTSSSKHRPHSPASDEYERYSDYDYYDRSSSTDRGSDGRHSPGGGYHISDRLSDQRDINLRLNIASSRSATIIPLRDSAGDVLSAERVSRIMGPFIFIGTPMISPLYKMFYGCQALSTGVKVHELNRAITGLDGFNNSRAPESLDKADRCYRTYVSQCRSANGDAADMDPKGDIAKEMMTTDREKSQLFLGIRSSELQQLYKYLVQMVTGSVSTSAVLYLRHVSESYIDRE